MGLGMNPGFFPSRWRELRQSFVLLRILGLHFWEMVREPSSGALVKAELGKCVRPQAPLEDRAHKNFSTNTIVITGICSGDGCWIWHLKTQDAWWNENFRHTTNTMTAWARHSYSTVSWSRTCKIFPVFLHPPLPDYHQWCSQWRPIFSSAFAGRPRSGKRKLASLFSHL